MSLLSTVNDYIKVTMYQKSPDTKLHPIDILQCAKNAIQLCLIAMLFNDYSSFDPQFYTHMKENEDNVFDKLTTSIYINHSVELVLTVNKLIENDIIKNKKNLKNIADELYKTKLLDPFVADELHKFYIRWKLCQLKIDLTDIYNSK